jgi:hypothetical protein
LAAKLINKPTLPINRFTLNKDRRMPTVLANVVIINNTFFVKHVLKKAPESTPAIPPM